MRKFFLFLVVVSLVALVAGIAWAEDSMTKLDLVVKVMKGTGLTPGDSIMTVAIRCGMDVIQSAALYPVCIDTIRIDLASGQEWYPLPSDCYRPLAVYIDPTGRALDWVNYYQKQKVPDAMTISDERMDKISSFQDDSVKLIGFDPVPTATDSAMLIYEANATEIAFGVAANAQRIRIRECYHPALVSATKYFLYQAFSRWDVAAVHMKEIETFINMAERKLSVPPIDLLMSPRSHTRP